MAGTLVVVAATGSSADRRAGEVDLIDRALGVFAISSLLRVLALKP